METHFQLLTPLYLLSGHLNSSSVKRTRVTTINFFRNQVISAGKVIMRGKTLIIQQHCQYILL